MLITRITILIPVNQASCLVHAQRRLHSSIGAQASFVMQWLSHGTSLLAAHAAGAVDQGECAHQEAGRLPDH